MCPFLRLLVLPAIVHETGSPLETWAGRQAVWLSHSAGSRQRLACFGIPAHCSSWHMLTDTGRHTAAHMVLLPSVATFSGQA